MEIDELKQELARLEEKTEPVQAVPEPESTVTGVFDRILKETYGERAQQEQRERAARANQVSKTCGDCYFVQRMTQNVCELCCTTPHMWLPASEHPPNLEMEMLRNMAAEYSVEQLKTALRSGWSSNRPERQRAAENILAARIRQQDIQEVRNKVAAAVKTFEQEDKRREIQPPKERVRELATVYDRQLESVRAQLAALQRMM